MRFWMSNPSVLAWQKQLLGHDPSYQDAMGLLRNVLFDYRKAWSAADTPRVNEADGLYHWGSAGKSKNHPTYWKEEAFQRTGMNPDDLVKVLSGFFTTQRDNTRTQIRNSRQ